MIAAYSCKNPDSIVGLNVQPPGDKINLATIDTVTLRTSTVKDSVLSSNKVLNPVGSYDSKVYGITNASVYAQVYFGVTPTFGDSLYSDSIVLKLAYSGYYGDTTTALTVHVYQLTQDMNTDSTYYSNTTFNYGTELASYTFTPHPTTPDSESTSALPPILRIPLSKSLADSILNMFTLGELSGNDVWITNFKGIYVKVDPVTTPGKGCMCYFNMGSSDSKMTLYFHNDTPARDTVSYDFLFTGARFNHQEHDYTGTPVASQLHDTTVAVNYIQGAAGLKVYIQMPYIQAFAAKKNLAINRAELIINAVPNSNDTLSPPSSLWLQTIDSTGAEAYIPDQFESTTFYGGTYNTSTSQYIFNLTHYFQNVVKGTTTDRGLYLGVSGASLLEYFGVIEANGVIIGSGNKAASSSSKMKLRLYYTKLN